MAGEPLIVLGLDDATLEVDAQRSWDSPGGVSPLDQTVFMGAGLGERCIIVSHSFSSLSSQVRQNIQTYFFVRVLAEEAAAVKRALRLTPEQLERLMALAPGEFLAFAGSFWPKPVLVTFDPPAAGVLSEDERRRTVRGFLAGVAATKAPTTAPTGEGASATSTTKAAGAVSGETGSRADKEKDFRSSRRAPRASEGSAKLSAEELEVLVTLRHGPMTSMELYGACRKSPAKGSRLVTGLEAKGCAGRRKVISKKRGGNFTYVALTDGGWSELEARGFKREKTSTRGSGLHDLAAGRIKERGVREGHEVAFEYTFGGRCFDAAWKHRNGQRTFFEIGLSSPEHEVENLVKAVAIPGVVTKGNRLVLVARDDRFRKEVMRILKKRDPEGIVGAIVEMEVLSNFVGEQAKPGVAPTPPGRRVRSEDEL